MWISASVSDQMSVSMAPVCRAADETRSPALTPDIPLPRPVVGAEDAVSGCRESIGALGADVERKLENGPGDPGERSAGHRAVRAAPGSGRPDLEAEGERHGDLARV